MYIVYAILMYTWYVGTYLVCWYVVGRSVHMYLY